MKGRSCIVTPECCIEHDLHVAHLARLSGMQGIIDRLLNLGAAVMWRQLLFMPAWKDMRAICRKHGFDPPELSPRKSGAAASIAVTDWAFETPQPVPPKVHVRQPFAGLCIACLGTCVPSPQAVDLSDQPGTCALLHLPGHCTKRRSKLTLNIVSRIL